MNYNYLKKLSIVALSLMTSAMTAMADSVLSVGGFSLKSGEQNKQLTIDLNSDGGVSVMQFEVTLPEHTTLSSNFATTGVLAAAGSTYEVMQTEMGQGTNKYLVVVANPKLTLIPEGEQSILTFGISADSDYDPDGSKITISNIKGANADGESADMSLAQNGEFLNQSTGNMSGAVAATPDGVVTVTLNLNNNIDLCHLGATITLPAGVSIAPDATGALFQRTDRIAAVSGSDLGNGQYSLVIGSENNDIIEKGDGAIVTFYLVAGSEFAGEECMITLTDINASDENAKSYDLDMVEITIEQETAEILKDAVLAQAKAAAIAAVEAAAGITEEVTLEDLPDNIKGVVNTATNDINDATSVDGINSVKVWAVELIANMDAYNKYIDQLKANLDNAVEKNEDGTIIYDAEGWEGIISDEDGAKAALEASKSQYDNSEGKDLEYNKSVVKGIYDTAVTALANNRLAVFADTKDIAAGSIAALRGIDENKTDEITKLIDDAEAELNKLEYDTEKFFTENAAAVNAILSKLNDDIQAVKDAAALAQAKTAAKEAIDNEVTWGLPEGQAPAADVLAAANEAKENIEAAETVAAVNQAKDNGIAEIQRLKALATAKANAKTEILNYAGITPTEPGSDEMQAIIEEINGDIDAAESTEALAEVVAAGKATIDAQKQKEEQAAELAAAKESAKTAINNAVNEGLEEGDAPAVDVDQAGRDAISAINAAETVNAVNAAKKAGLDEIARLKQLATDKVEAITAIDGKVKELYPNNDAPESVTAAASAAKTAINEATTSEAVATAQQNGIAAIEAAAELVANKATAIAAIDAKVAEIAGEGQAPEAVTAAAATAKENIAAAEDNDGVDAAKQAGLDAIQLIMDKAAFEAYKTEVKESLSSIAESQEANQTVLDLIDSAETDLTELAYDEEKSLEENKAAVDAIKTQLVKDVKAERLRDFTAHKTIALAALEAAKATAPDVEELNKIYEASKKCIEDAEYDNLFSLIGNKAALDYYVDEYKDAVQKYVYVNNYTDGDIDENGEVDIYDYAKLAKFIMEMPQDYEKLSDLFTESSDKPSWEKDRLANLYNVNNDDDINVTDLTAVVNIIINGAAGPAQTETTGAKGKAAGTAAISTEMVGNDLIFNLTNSAQLVAMQMDVTISGAEVMAEQLSRRAGAHELMIRHLGGDQYRIMIVGAANEMFEGGKGELFRLSLNGVANNVEFGKIVAADARANSYAVAVGGTVTGVNAIDAESAAVKSYTIGGQQQNSVKAGLNIVVGADGKARKVLK